MSTYSTQKGDAVTDSNIIRWQDVAIDDLPRDLRKRRSPGPHPRVAKRLQPRWLYQGHLRLRR